jgi:hypothetical protein
MFMLSLFSKHVYCGIVVNLFSRGLHGQMGCICQLGTHAWKVAAWKPEQMMTGG